MKSLLFRIYSGTKFLADHTNGRACATALRLSPISRKRLEIEAWFQMTTNRKWPVANRMVTWPMTSRGPKGQGRYPNMLRAQYLENSWRCYLATIAN